MLDQFPLDIAFEGAFFDRESERKRLRGNIESNTHTLITSPRRYGKTSLVFKVIAELQASGVQIDMMLATDAEKMKNVILDGIGCSIANIISGKKRVLEKIKKVFLPFNTIESIELGQLTIKLRPYSEKAPHLIIFEALQRLENCAEELDKNVLLFFDEYQHVLDIKGIEEFEASLRSFAQTAKRVVCVFSGSNRHLLQKVFSDQSRPFYNMCDHMLLGRISAEDYTEHLLTLSQQQWGKAMPQKIVELILELTARHAHIVNALCRRLWQLNAIPNAEILMESWNELVSEKRYEINSDFDKLTPIQRTILVELARDPFSQPTSAAVIKRLNASTSGITNALKGLQNNDYIYQEASGRYRVLNPVMEYILR